MIKRDFIVIEGNIGAGKTSLTNMIGDEFNAQIILERFADNPFLPKFYDDKDRYSFPLELSFLADRYNQLKDEITSRDLFSSFTIADYYFMKSLIFSKSTLSKDEYALYRQLFDIIYQSVPKPDLYVYLHVSVEKLLWNIQMRGREYEKNISSDYLLSIQEGYFDFFKKISDLSFLIIDINQIDFVNNIDEYRHLQDLILNRTYPKGITREIL
jgi:deoxyguanosine kinase